MRRALAIAGWALALPALLAALGLGLALREARIAALVAAALPPAAPGPSARPEAPAALGVRRILLLGDSRVKRWDPPPTLPPGTELLLRGVGGETSRGLLARLPDELAAKPDLVILATGINDLVAAGLAPAAEAAIGTALLANLAAAAAAAQAAGARVLLLTIPRPAAPSPARRLLLWSDRIPALVAAANGGIRALAAPPGLAVLDADAALAPGPGPLPDALAADTLHLSAAGYGALNALLHGKIGR